jgi:hypothetical protein
MSLTDQVIALLEEDGPATVDDLLPKIEGDYTRRQVMVCLRNATFAKSIVKVQRGATKGRYGGTYPATYAVPEDDRVPVHRPKPFPLNDWLRAAL